MLLMDGGAAVKISNGTGNFEDARVGAGRETEAISNQLQHPVAAGVQLAVFLDETGGHLGVAVDFGAFVTFQLDFTGVFDSFGDGGGTFRFATVGEIAVLNGRNFDMDIDPVEQRA